MAIVDANIAREIAEQNPELHKARQTAFGTDYLTNIEQGTGTAQYYGGWGNVPGYGFTSTTAAGPEVAAETVAPVAPIVTAAVSGDQGQGTMPTTAQPTTTDYLGGATEGTSTIGNLANLTTPTTVGPFDYTDAAVTAPALDLSGTSQELINRGVIETPQEWYARTYGGPTMIGKGPLHQIGSDFPADYESLDNEERAIIDQEYTNAYGINTTPEGSLIDKAKSKVSGGLENILDLGAAAISPIGTIIKKGLDAIPESQSQIEYERYNPTQQQAIDAAYGTGGVMEGYNPVSIAGEGALATINERIANREANVSDPANDKTLQELKALRNTLDPQPVTYVDDWGITRGDAITAEKIAAEERAANAPDAYTILGEEGPKQGVGPRYSDELNWRDQAKHTFGSPVQWEATDDLESDAATLEAVLAEERAAEERAANAPDRYTILGEEGIVQPQGVGPRYSDELNWRDQAKHTFGSPVQWEATDDLESDAGAAALETALGMKPSHTIADVSGPSTWRDDVAINVASDYPPGDTSDEAGGYEGSGPDYSGGVTTGTSFDADTDPADEGTKASYAGDVTQVGSGRQDREGGSSSSGGGGCVIATHAVDSGAFTPETKREAVRWCIKNLHRTWWGEAVRKGYRYYGQKAIEEGKAKNHYQEFKDYVAFGTGKKRTLKTAWTFVYRTIQFFIKGITIKDA